MTGKICGRGNAVRYYQINKARSSPRSDHPLRAFIPAEPLERAVLDVLREVLISRPDLRGAVERALKKRAAEQDHGSNDRGAIERELHRRQRQIASALDSLTGDDAADRPIQERLTRYREDVARLTASLRSTPQPPVEIDIDAVADRMAAEMAGLADQLLSDDPEAVRQVIRLLIGRMDVDLTTRVVEIDLRLPNWLASSLSRQPMMGLKAMLACKPFNQTHRLDGAEIAVFRCEQMAKRPVCFDCRRIRLAA
jgi:hypothetical protein